VKGKQISRQEKEQRKVCQEREKNIKEELRKRNRNEGEYKRR